jgi:hypothetical protein
MATETARWGSPWTMERGALERVLPPWRAFLLAGAAWIVVSVILFRFDLTSVHAVSLLFGIVAVVAGVAEIGRVFIARGWWKLLNLILAVAFIAAGIVAFIHPGDTFVALAAVLASSSSLPGRSTSSKRLRPDGRSRFGGCSSSEGSSSSCSGSGRQASSVAARPC